MDTLLTIIARAADVRGGRFDFETLASRVTGWWQRYRSRCALRDLDPRLLRDVGLTPGQRDRECGKPFFD